MAIEKIISIVSSELKTGKSGKQYLDVVDQDNTRFSCWDESLWNNLGKNANARIEFEQKGIFKNIVIVEPMAEAIKHIPTPPIQPTPQEIGKKVEPKNKAFALSYAKDLAVADKIKALQVIPVAELFNRYLNGEITVPDENIARWVDAILRKDKEKTLKEDK